MPAEKMKKLVCWKCDEKIAMIDTDLRSIVIKDRNFCVYAIGGMLKIVCHICATINLIIDDRFEQDNADLVKAEELIGHGRAVVKPWIKGREWYAMQKGLPHKNNGRSRPQQEIRENV